VSITDSVTVLRRACLRRNPDGSFNETLFRDFGERSMHEMALNQGVDQSVLRKRTDVHYWTDARRAAARVDGDTAPSEDFDGVLAGSPAINLDRLQRQSMAKSRHAQDLRWPDRARQSLTRYGGRRMRRATTALNRQARRLHQRALCLPYDRPPISSLLCCRPVDQRTAACDVDEAIAVNRLVWSTRTARYRCRRRTTETACWGACAPISVWFGLTRGSLLTGHPYWDGLAGRGRPLSPRGAGARRSHLAEPSSDKWKTIGTPDFYRVHLSR